MNTADAGARVRPGKETKPSRFPSPPTRSQRGASGADASPRNHLLRREAALRSMPEAATKVAPRPPQARPTAMGDHNMRWSTDQGSCRAKLYIVAATAADRALLGRELSDRDFDVVWSASGEEFLGAVQLDAPGTVVADLELPDMSGFSLLNAMRRHGRVLPLLLLTETNEATCVMQALRLGVFDLFRKPANMPELRLRVGEALRVDADRFTRRRLLVRAHAAVSALSPRERQVMELVVAGAANKVIASDLGISEKTVEVHRGKVMRKMRVDSLAELVRVNVILEESGRREIGL